MGTPKATEPKSQNVQKVQKSATRKAQRLKNARVQKRPIIHPPIPSPYAGPDQPKVVYVSTKTPFVSAVKRVRKLLSLIEKRSLGNVDLVNGKGNDKEKLKALDPDGASKKEKEPEKVLIKATGRAIEKACSLALFFQGQDDLNVQLRTAAVGVVDDIVPIAKSGEEDEAEDQDEEEELPETQVRKIPMLEVSISMK